MAARMPRWNTATKADLIEAVQRADQIMRGLSAQVKGHVEDKVVWRQRAEAAEAKRDALIEALEEAIPALLRLKKITGSAEDHLTLANARTALSQTKGKG